MQETDKLLQKTITQVIVAKSGSTSYRITEHFSLDRTESCEIFIFLCVPRSVCLWTL